MKLNNPEHSAPGETSRRYISNIRLGGPKNRSGRSGEQKRFGPVTNRTTITRLYSHSLVSISTKISRTPLIKLSYNLYKYLHKIYQPKPLTCQYHRIFYNPNAYMPNPQALKTSLISSDSSGLTKSMCTAPSYHLRAKYSFT
jgi:hypothetical protein